MRRYLFLLLAIMLMFSNNGCQSKNRYENNNITPIITKSPEIQPTKSQDILLNGITLPPDQSESTESKDSLRFVVMADSRGSDQGVNSEIVKKILGEVKKLSPQPEFALMPGDLIHGSKKYDEIKSQLRYFKQIITEFYPVQFYYPGIGNHEMKAGAYGEKAFSETFSELKANFLDGYHKTSYYFDSGDARFFMLNSNHPKETHKIAGEQLNWLKANIDPKKKYNIFLLHEPPYPTGAHVGSSLDYYPAARDAFWEVVDASNNPIVFCGHEHNYSRRLIDSNFNEQIDNTKYEFNGKIYQIITGSFGAPLTKNYTDKKNVIIPPIPQYHFVIVDMNENGVSIQAVNMDGETLDSFQIEK